MLIRSASALVLSLLAGNLLTACATHRQIAVDYPKTDNTPLKPIKGQSGVSADDYYLQLISEFEFKSDNALKAGCSDMGSAYENGDLSAALVFNTHNDALKFKRETSGFLYQATIGKCNFKLETRKAYLTPWLRLDSAKDTIVDYNFLTSDSQEANLSQLVDDVNAASDLLILSGVGTSIGLMGKAANNLVHPAPQTTPKSTPSAKSSSETHTLPAVVALDNDNGQLIHSRLPVYEVVDGGLKFWASGNRLLGELHVYPQLNSSLLIKTVNDGIPDAHDLSLEELLRVAIQSADGEIPLKQVIEKAAQSHNINLKPNWQNYAEVESQCRQLKLLAKDLGFNKFDRNALLYYFLTQSPDWKTYNLTVQQAMTDSIRPKLLDDYRNKDFSGCLAEEDYQAMKIMHLPVNSHEDWNRLTQSRQKKEDVFSAVQSAARQLLAALKNPDKDEMARQLYPLLNNDKAGNGNTLLQNHLGNFGLETLLGVPSIAAEGVVINAGQLAGLFTALGVETYSCARPAQDQGQALPNIGILLFATKPGSPREKGGALEFEIAQGKIIRLAFQHPAFRDFEQNLNDYPDLGGCRIDGELVNRLH